MEQYPFLTNFFMDSDCSCGHDCYVCPMCDRPECECTCDNDTDDFDVEESDY